MSANNKQFDHDIKSAISAITGAMEIVREEWDKNPELVERIVPLTELKVAELKILLEKYYSQFKI